MILSARTHSQVALGLATDSGSSSSSSSTVLQGGADSASASSSLSAPVNAKSSPAIPENAADGSWSKEKSLFFIRSG